MRSLPSWSQHKINFKKRSSKVGRRNRRLDTKVSYDTLEPKQMLATIGWTSGDITDSGDVSTNGNLVFAINGSNESGVTTTVNGVSFVSSIRDNSASQTQSQSPGNESLTTTLGNDNGGSFTNGGSGGVIGTLIEGGWWGATSGDSATATLSGLTVGDNYEIQIFASDARGNRDNGYVTRLDNGTGGTGIDLQLNNQPVGGRPGDYGIGTFTADSSTQSFELTGFVDGSNSTGRIQINAIQLRKLDPVVLMPGAHPLINEFSASNSGLLDDDNGESSDWIEIFNAGEDAVNLAGFSLTDDPAIPSKYVFPSTTLVGGQYLIVFAGDDADPTMGTDLYTGFGLGVNGDYVGFYSPTGNLITEFGTGGANYPQQYDNVSYGFVADDSYSQPSYFATPTPGSANISPVDGVVDVLPTVSVDRGFYDQTFNVTVASQTPGATLAYTTDGSEPSFTNGTLVQPNSSTALASAVITVSDTTSLRTAALKSGFFTAGATTHTYVFPDDVIATELSSSNESNALLRASLLSIPTLSFNYENVIVDSDVPEQLASIEWLAPNGSEGFQIDAGIKGFGGYFTNFDKKSFRVNFRSQYGDSRLDFPLFEGFDNGIAPTESFDSLDFRSGSHDMVQRGFYMSNRFVDDTLLEAGHAVPHGRFVHIYTNGVYWGQYHMRERWDDDFLALYYGGNKDDYEAVNGNVNNGNTTPNGWSPGEVYDGDGTAWSNINALADTDGSGNPTGGYQELKDVVNLEQYLDYMLVYMAGRSENEYRAGGSEDGSVPYSFYLNDADGWFRGTNNQTGNAGPGNILGTLIAEGDPEFMTLYADRIHRMFGEDGVLSPDRAEARLQARLDEIDLSFHAEAARWGYRSHASWSGAAQTAINGMLQNAATSTIQNLRSAGLYPNVDAPSYLVNGITQNGGEITAGDALSFTADQPIYYTTDGTDPRIEGGGINPNATLFTSGITTTTPISLGSAWNYLDDGSNQGTAWRNPGFNDSAWASGPGELGYGDGDEATPVGFIDADPNQSGTQKNATTYFRRTFNLAAGSYLSATLELKRDDGAAVYLNGNLVGLSNLNAGAAFDDYATGLGDGFITLSIPTNLLQAGINTLAVEIHQASPTSSDISFNAELTVDILASSSSQPVTLNTSTNVRSRTFSGGQWSAVNDSLFVIPVSQSDLRISEIHYNPAVPTAAEVAAGFIDNDEFEFIELFNPSTTGTINLSGVQLSDGVTFNFGDTNLLPGQRAVVVEDIDAFMARYGDSATILGEWSGGLSNGGEEVTLLDSSLNEIMSVNYGDNDPWYALTDGDGFSLVLDDPVGTPTAELGKYYSWRASSEFGGTPGAASASPSGVVINEILAHTDAPSSDTIELYNPTAQAIDVGLWFLSDSIISPFKFQIPAGTVIPAGGYLVYDESDFNPTPATPGANDFALSSYGDDVVLSQVVVVDGSVVPFVEDSVRFGATFNGDTLGRLPNGTGRLAWLASSSFGSANSTDVEVGPLVISEVNYHPEDPNAAALAIDPLLTDNDLEYIEVANPTSSTVDLTNWRLRGDADYNFAAGTTLAAGEAIVVVSFDPSLAINTIKLAAFEAHYGIGASVTIVGGLSGGLSNSSGRVTLQQPDGPSALGVIPHVVVDELVYDDVSPWPATDGTGQTLERDDLSASGIFSSSWISAAPTPGVFENDFLIADVNLDGIVNFLDIAPFIALLTENAYQLEADVNEDGFVNFLDISFFIAELTAQ